CLTMTLTLTLKKNSELIEGILVIDNQILSHRLRLKLNTGVENTRSIASLPFGFISRESLTEDIPNWFKSYVEYPIDLEPFDKSVSVANEHYHVSAFGKGLKEYQFQKGSLYLTLLATTSQLGKPNLAYRPGRASGDTTKKGHVMMPTPMAELLGEQRFEFALVVNAQAFDEFATSQHWAEYISPNIAYQNQVLNKFIHRLDNKIQADDERIARVDAFSLLKIDGSAFDTTFMPSLYDTEAEVLRLANPTSQPLAIGDFDFSHYAKYEFVNAQEAIVAAQSEIAPYDMVSIKLWRN
ncbi:MAG TPA: alpha-mannosidase, partial [Lactococcus sp.]|nr:alpha-mannosidase [Lactococcus sp.]